MRKIKIKVKQIKEFLNFFLFPIISLILVIIQCNIIGKQTEISKKQLELANKQLDLERYKEEALFTIYTQQEISGNYGNHYDLENMYVESNGKFTKIDSCEIFTFIDLHYYDFETNYSNETTYQLSNYFVGVRRHSFDKLNPLIIQGSPGNNEKIVSFKYSFKDKKTITFDIRRYVKINYVNLFNENKTIYLFVEPLRGSQLIEYSDETKIFFEPRMDSISIDDLTPEYFLKNLNLE